MKDNNKTNYTNVTLNLIQSLFKFNKLSNGETCQGLLRRFVHKIANNNEISPHNDMNNKILNLVQDDNAVVAQNDVINKNVKNLFPYFPISLSLKKKVDSSPNALALNGYGSALMLELVRLRMTAFTLAETQSDVVIPNKLDNGETCQGLRHWRLFSNLKNNFSKPVRNDMVEFGGVTRHPEGDSPKDLQTQNHVITRKNIEQEMQKSTQSDVVIPNELGNSETLSGIVTSLRTQKYK